MTVFPTHLFKFATQRYALTGRTMTGGPSISGTTQSVELTGGGRWVFEFGDGRLRSREQLLAWRALEALIDDGVTHVEVPICDLRQAPVPLVNGNRAYGSGSVPHSDDAYFSDDTGYVSGAPEGSIALGAALRATELRLQMNGAGALLGGEHFSLTHADPIGRRMYRVRSIEQDHGSGVYDVTFRPPLRASIAAGMVADFRNPSCLMKVAEPHSMAPAVENLRFANVGVTFVEAFA